MLVEPCAMRRKSGLAQYAQLPSLRSAAGWGLKWRQVHERIQAVLQELDEDATVVLGSHSRTLKRFNKVADLVVGFESPWGLESLSTIDWVVSKEKSPNINDVVGRTYAWNNRKRQFPGRQISLAVNVLSDKGWFDHALGM